jgi:hypothetical protein
MRTTPLQADYGCIEPEVSRSACTNVFPDAQRFLQRFLAAIQ